MGIRAIGMWARAIGVRHREKPSPCEAGQDVGRSLQHCPAVGFSSADDGIAIGEWPEDPHVEPAWVRRCEARFGEMLRIRTRAQFEQQVELCAISADAETAEYQAAVKFLAWLRETGRTGELSAGRLGDAWSDYCKSIGHVPASEAHMRGYLGKLPGANKGLSEKKVGNKRNRPTVWKIEPAQVAQKKRAERREPMRMAA